MFHRSRVHIAECLFRGQDFIFSQVQPCDSYAICYVISMKIQESGIDETARSDEKHPDYKFQTQTYMAHNGVKNL